MKDRELDSFLQFALKEDVGTGDITTLSCISQDAISKGKFIAKADGVLCGIEIAQRTFALVDPSICMQVFILDGQKVQKGDVIAEISGNAQGILTGERVALNIMQRLSGIATRTAQAVETVAGTPVKIVDTRKATPGLRVLEKYAVRMGGGHNHRFNLADGILIKDNHIKAAGGISQAISAVKARAPHTLRIEVETETLAEVEEALNAGADIIMLDNMSLDEMRQAVSYVGNRALTEASGNMGERDLKAVAETGVDIISVGALTHSVIAMDISLKFYE